MKNLNALLEALYHTTPDYINGVSYGFKTVDGSETPQKSIVFHVTKKKLLSEIPKNEVISKSFDAGGVNFITDVQERSEINQVCAIGQFCGPAELNTTHKNLNRPLMGGASISSNESYASTLGGFFIDQHDGSLVGLSVAHGLIKNPGWNFHKYIAPPARGAVWPNVQMENFEAPNGSAVMARYRTSLISQSETNTEDVNIYQPALGLINNRNNKIGYIKRYFPISGLEFSGRGYVFNTSDRTDPATRIFYYASDMLNLGEPYDVYDQRSLLRANYSFEEYLDVLKQVMEAFFVAKYGVGFDLYYRYSNRLSTDYTGPEEPIRLTYPFGPKGFPITRVDYTNYVDAAVIAIDSLNPAMAKQLGDSSQKIYPVATTEEIDTYLLGSTVFLNGSSKGFRGSDNSNDSCSMYCDAINASISIMYPNPYEGLLQTNDRELVNNVHLHRFSWKARTGNLAEQLMTKVNELFDRYQNNRNMAERYTWSSLERQAFNNRMYYGDNTGPSLFTEYLASPDANLPHPDPTIEEFIQANYYDGGQKLSEPIPIVFSDLFTFRYRKELTPEERAALNVRTNSQTPEDTFAIDGFLNSVFPEFNVTGPGDSGGLVIADINGTKKIVGMMIAAASPWRQRGFAARIDRIMDRLDLAPWDGDTSKVKVSDKNDAKYIIREGVMDPPIIKIDGKKYWQLNTIISTPPRSTSYESWHDNERYMELLNEMGPAEKIAVNAPVEIQKVLSSRYVTFNGEDGEGLVAVSGLTPGQTYRFRVSIDTGYGFSERVVTDPKTA